MQYYSVWAYLLTMIHEEGSKGYWFIVNEKDIIHVFPGSIHELGQV